jgi:hypothetical protein
MKEEKYLRMLSRRRKKFDDKRVTDINLNNLALELPIGQQFGPTEIM